MVKIVLWFPKCIFLDPLDNTGTPTIKSPPLGNFYYTHFDGFVLEGYSEPSLINLKTSIHKEYLERSGKYHIKIQSQS